MHLHLVNHVSPGFWIGFAVFIAVMLALDLGVFHRQAHEMKFREALAWSLTWTLLAVLFCSFIAYKFGSNAGLEFATGYLIEWALSVDNIFIMIVIFSYFSVPKSLQHKVLFWGILGAIAMRTAFIFLGTALVHRFNWIMYLFGAILIFTAVKLYFQKETDIHPERNIFLRIFKKFFPCKTEYHGGRFFVRDAGVLYATPLALVVVVVEATDIVFAVDSIPAVFAVTTDPFIILTSNIFAILGLRSLYFLLVSVINKFHLLKIGLSLVLAFVGIKMLVADFFKIPTPVSLAMVALLIGGSVIMSLLRPAKK